MRWQGHLHKMHSEAGDPITYRLELGDEVLPLNSWLGRSLRIEYLDEIECVYCGRTTRKSFSQGYCYPCFTRLAQCDLCIMSPEKCHFHLGTCREPEWARQNCMQAHVVYLSNTSGVKVGITRQSQIPTRWIDQGALQALSILRVSQRYHAGLIESAFRDYLSDRTNWRKMLKNEVDPVDLYQVYDSYWPRVKSALADDLLAGVEEMAQPDAVVSLNYPALRYPTKVTSFNLDKNPRIEGVLEAIKGQYLVFDSGVINIRKYGGYLVRIEEAC